MVQCRWEVKLYQSVRESCCLDFQSELFLTLPYLYSLPRGGTLDENLTFPLNLYSNFQ